MADAAPVVHIGENSPEKVAYDLLMCVVVAEGKTAKVVGGSLVVTSGADRKWLLDTYAECLMAVRDPIGRKGGGHT